LVKLTETTEFICVADDKGLAFHNLYSMKKIQILLFFIVLCILKGYTQQRTIVFEAGKEGYASYRIPAIVQLKNGTILAFSEGRVDDAKDFGNVDIVYKTSQDHGKTWSRLRVAVDNGNKQAGNIAPVLDKLDPEYQDGRLFLFYNTGNNHEGAVREGNGIREVWYITSLDHGMTWSKPINITLQVHQPNAPSFNKSYQFPADWRAYANTPGQGFQFVTGPYKGRIYIAANHSSGAPLPQGMDYQAHAYYSDDHGKTFKLSATIPFKGGNESMAAQISPTEVYMNSRNQQGNVKRRIVSYSSDGGMHWDTTYYDNKLPDPVNQGATISRYLKKGKFLLAVCNAADTLRRDNLTLRLSKDKGKTWYFNKVVAKAPKNYKGAYSAYCDMIFLDKKNMGILYEFDRYNYIVFQHVAIK